MPDPKQQLLHEFARIGKALASPARLELLDLLAQGEKTVETLARQTSRSVTSTSNHLKELRTAALVETRRDGVFVHYRLASDAVHAMVRSLQEVARSRLAEVQRLVDGYFTGEEAYLEPVTAPELAQRLERHESVVIDVRPAAEWSAAHIPGAISMPPDELEHRMAELPKDREIVAYCRGPYCVYAHDAVKLLRSHGYQARRLEIGLPDWRAAGFHTATGAAQ
jgi:rhodanese-related sulfurtransferase/DNA-binding transcriptional ArsR family regulator